MNACMQWSIENFGMTYPKIRTFAKCQSLAKMEMNQHFGKTNGNLFTYKHKRERPIHTHMNISLSSPYTHAWASSILSIYTHIWPSILALHTYTHHEHRSSTYIWAHHPYTHEHILTWTTYRDERPIARKDGKERCARRPEKEMRDRRPPLLLM